MTENKTRRNFLIGSAAVPGTIAAAAALQNNPSNAATPQTKTTAVGKKIDPDRLSRFKEELHEKALETLDFSSLFKLIDDYGFPDRTVQVQVKIMLDDMRSLKNLKQEKSGMTDTELEESLMAIAAEEIMIQSCYICGGSSC